MAKVKSFWGPIFSMKISSILALVVAGFFGISIAALIVFSFLETTPGFPRISKVNAEVSGMLTLAPDVPAPVGPEKIIFVSLKDQTLTFVEDMNIKGGFKISSGLRATPTPPGEYTILKKKPVVNYRGANYNYPNTKWNLMFKTGNPLNYYIHGAPWHNNFGRPMSHGCINVAYKDMEGLYNWADEGTKLIIQEDKLDLTGYFLNKLFPTEEVVTTK